MEMRALPPYALNTPRPTSVRVGDLDGDDDDDEADEAEAAAAELEDASQLWVQQMQANALARRETQARFAAERARELAERKLKGLEQPVERAIFAVA